MNTATADNLRELHRAVARSARTGASYEWIVGVLAGCLAADTTTAEARAISIRTLNRPPVSPVRRRVA